MECRHHCPIWRYESKFNLSKNDTRHSIDDSKDWNGAHRTIHRRKTGYKYKDEANDVPTHCNTVLVRS